MVRDYCEEIESAILDCIDANENGDNIDISEYDSHVVSYLEDSDSYAYHWQNANINQRYRGAIHSNARRQVQESFSAVREYAQSMSTQISEDGSYAGNGYLDVILGLKDLITVSACDKGTDNIAAINRTNDNTNHYHALQGFESSIFGDSTSFQKEVESCGSGILYETYNYLKPEVNGWDHFDELMAQNPGDVKLWEYAAVIMIAESYIQQDSETGYASLNLDEYTDFLEHCYISTYVASYHPPQQDHTTFSVSPVAAQCAQYWNQSVQQVIAQYGGYLYLEQDNEYKYELEALFQAQNCMLGIALYGDVTVSNYGPGTMDIELQSDDAGNIEMSLVAHCIQDSVSTIMINQVSIENNDSYHSAMSDVFASQIQNASLVSSLTFVDSTAQFAIGFVPYLGTASGFVSIFTSGIGAYNETEANNNWLQGHIVNNEIQSYLEVLNGHACVIQHDGELYISDICIDRTALYIDVAYYNINHPNDRITEAQLLSELNGYMDGGSVEHLEAFREWDNGGNHGECALFRENIICYLRDTYGVNLHYATQEQLDEAINYASQQ